MITTSEFLLSLSLSLLLSEEGSQASWSSLSLSLFWLLSAAAEPSSCDDGECRGLIGGGGFGTGAFGVK